MQTAAPDPIERYYDQLLESLAARFSAEDLEAGRLMMHLAHTYNTLQKRMSTTAHAHGLTPAGMNVLALVCAGGKEGRPLHDVSDLLLVSRANVTGLIDSLESRGLVKRFDHRRDRRIRLARITAKGRALLNEIRPVYYRRLGHLASNLTATERRALLTLLRKWREGARRVSEGDHS